MQGAQVPLRRVGRWVGEPSARGRRVQPALPIELEVDGEWVPALLTYWQRRADGWYASFTRYDGGLSWTGMVPASRVRPRD